MIARLYEYQSSLLMSSHRPGSQLKDGWKFMSSFRSKTYVSLCKNASWTLS